MRHCRAIGDLDFTILWRCLEPATANALVTIECDITNPWRLIADLLIPECGNREMFADFGGNNQIAAYRSGFLERDKLEFAHHSLRSSEGTSSDMSVKVER